MDSGSGWHANILMSKDLMANLDGKILCPQGAGKPFVCRSFVKEQSKLRLPPVGRAL